jgi:decaprenylphospho-beta-D-ribofuranose 2-oxidase
VAAALELFRARAGGPGAWTGVIARGLGRSYGDAAQLEGGLALETAALREFELDPQEGVVDAGAGVTIGELLARVVPAGWMVPVVPGTQHVSVGGAIASDIHGKNHGAAGTFGSHIASLTLLLASGDVVEVAPGADGGLFEATLGGMGLTGVILASRIRLGPVSSPFLSVDTDRVGDLDHALAALEQPGGPHRVAWLDLLGSRSGRGIVTRAAHHPGFEGTSRAHGAATVTARAAVPERWPEGVLRTSTVRAFNELRYRRSPARERGRVESFGRHMFPLDGLEAWPRLYGPHGLLQYQFVVPYGSEEVLRAVVAELRRARIPCYLAVLKDFGEANEAPLSFPIAGWTLSLDLPRAAPGIRSVLDRCDDLVAQSGGRVYLSKDARLRPDALRAMYPGLEEWRAVRDGVDPEMVWRSDLGVRTGLVSGAPR